MKKTANGIRRLTRANLVGLTEQVIRKLLHDVGGSTGLNLLVVDTNEDGFVGLHGDHTTGSLLAVDGAVIRTDGDIAHTTELESTRADGTGVLEGVGQGEAVCGRDGETARCGPGVAIVTNNGSLSHSASTDEVVVNIRLPRHCCVRKVSRGGVVGTLGGHKNVCSVGGSSNVPCSVSQPPHGACSGWLTPPPPSICAYSLFPDTHNNQLPIGMFGPIGER